MKIRARGLGTPQLLQHWLGTKSPNKHYVDCLVFIHGRTRPQEPGAEVVISSWPLVHASDKLVWGKHHRLMTMAVLSQALHVISAHVGLEEAVTSRKFRTSYAFKLVIKGNILDWRIASQMGHFGGNENLVRRVYAPNFGPIKTRYTASSPSSTLASENFMQALEVNGAIALLPNPDQINFELLCTAKAQLTAFHQHLKDQALLDSICMPTELTDGLIDTFASVNGGTKLSLKALVACLLLLTGVDASALSYIAKQPHPFDNQDITKGSNSLLLEWPMKGATHLCPSCHELFHPDKLSNDKATRPYSHFKAFTSCIEEKRKQLCCFVCSNLFPLDDTNHVQDCLQKQFEARLALGHKHNNTCILYSQSFQQWKGCAFWICPVALCMNPDWHTNNTNAHLAGTAALRSPL